MRYSGVVRSRGKLTFTGRVRIDGHFRGEIFSDDVLILGDGADVKATVQVGTLIVRGGRLDGSVEATRSVEIHAPGNVQGSIVTPQIFVEKGVKLDAECKMTTEESHSFEGVGARGAAELSQAADDDESTEQDAVSSDDEESEESDSSADDVRDAPEVE